MKIKVKKKIIIINFLLNFVFYHIENVYRQSTVHIQLQKVLFPKSL